MSIFYVDSMPKAKGGWDYKPDSAKGPKHWPDAGEVDQSPINIDTRGAALLQEGTPIKFVNYGAPFLAQIKNLGYTIQVKPIGSTNLPQIYGAFMDEMYLLTEYHFHWSDKDNEGSEHTVNGHHYPGEVQMLHETMTGKAVVLSVFLKLGLKGHALARECAVLNRVLKPGQSHDMAVVLRDKLPARRTKFWRYRGSLTYPPCKKNVTWIVMEEPISITKEQLSWFRKVQETPGHLLHKNFRPLQGLNGRNIFAITTP